MKTFKGTIQQICPQCRGIGNITKREIPTIPEKLYRSPLSVDMWIASKGYDVIEPCPHCKGLKYIELEMNGKIS